VCLPGWDVTGEPVWGMAVTGAAVAGAVSGGTGAPVTGELATVLQGVGNISKRERNEKGSVSLTPTTCCKFYPSRDK
jgi:hypothetical protein